jgi:hypothetical protein
MLKTKDGLNIAPRVASDDKQNSGAYRMEKKKLLGGDDSGVWNRVATHP